MSAEPVREWRALRTVVITVVIIGTVASVLFAAWRDKGVNLGSPSHSSPKPLPFQTHITQLGLPSLGIDYYAPNSYGQSCPPWTWLEPKCFSATSGPHGAAGDPGDFVLNSDLSFIHHEALGRFMRVWVSTDQIARITAAGRFLGLREAPVHDLDWALQRFHRYGLEVDLVLFTYSRDTSDRNQFRPIAIDGLHPQLRHAYLQALRAILGYLAANPIDRGTIRVIDLENEAYYQLEQYFDTPRHLGKFHQCLNGSDRVSTTCVDQTIVHPWLQSLYRTARSTTDAFLYTISDSGRLLSTDPNQQRYWMKMYPVDVYDIHLYANDPGASDARWLTGLKLVKPWFSGEVGCASSDPTCTYDGSRAAPVDNFFLQNFHRYGAQSLLIEQGYPTVWLYTDAKPSQQLTPTGIALQCQTFPEHRECDRFQ